MKLLFFTLLLVSMLLSSPFLADATAATPAPAPDAGFCNGKCQVRCSETGNFKRCFQFCCKCCNKCKCVPSGPKANKSECPCYRDWVSSKGTSKCP